MQGHINVKFQWYFGICIWYTLRHIQGDRNDQLQRFLNCYLSDLLVMNRAFMGIYISLFRSIDDRVQMLFVSDIYRDHWFITV